MRQQEWQRAYRSGVLNTVLQGKGHRAANDKMLWGRVGDVGYLNLLSMGGFGATRGDLTALDAALDDAIAAFDGARAVIVDISNNDGGGDRIAQHIAGRFADARRLAYTKIGFGAQGVEPQPFHVEPSKRARYLGPVYLLTSDIDLERRRGVRLVYAGAAERDACRRHHARRLLRHDHQAVAERLDAVDVGGGLSRPGGREL